MKLGNIQGNVTLSGYSGWIQLLSVEFPPYKFIQPPTAELIALIPNAKKIICTKAIDATSGGIFTLLVNGVHVPAKLAGKVQGYHKEYLRCEMNVAVESFYNGTEGVGRVNTHIFTLCTNSIQVIRS